MIHQLPGPGDLVARRYRVESQIGSGGFAAVYLATDLQHGTSVALKVLRPAEGGYDRETTLRFEREAEVLRSVRHENIVRLLDHGSGDVLFLVFELVGGDDLARLLDDGPLDVEHTLVILRQLLAALGAAHDAGVLHRDVKPENIRVMGVFPQLHIKLLDFGIARPTDDGSPGITKTGELVGTPRYMSPEQLTNRPLGPASDVYPAGMVGLEMLLGREAMHGNRWVDQLDRLRTGYVFALPGVEEDGVHLMHVLNRMTAQDLGARYPTAHAALNALDTSATTVFPIVTSPDAVAAGRRWAIVAGAIVVFAVAVMMLPGTNHEEPVSTARNGNGRALVLGADDAPPAPVLETVLATALEKPPRQDMGDDEPPAPAYGSEGCDLDPMETRDLPTYRPKNYDRHHPHPLIVMLRDRHMDSQSWLAGSGFPELADEHGFIVIAPIPEGFQPWVGDLSTAVDLVREDVSRTMAAACVDPGRIFVVAHGHGAAPAFRMACEPWVSGLTVYAHSSAAEACESFRGPFLLLHPTASRHQRVDDRTTWDRDCEDGPRDTFVERRRKWRNRVGLTNTKPVTWDVPGADCERFEGEHLFATCTYNGGRHWPGVPRKRLVGNLLHDKLGHESTACDGPEPREFRAAPVIWTFMSELAPADRQEARRALEPPRAKE